MMNECSAAYVLWNFWVLIVVVLSYYFIFIVFAISCFLVGCCKLYDMQLRYSTQIFND